jgi:hypothetical protein
VKQVFNLVHEAARRNAAQAVLSAPDGYRVEIRERTRSLDQNALMWDLLTEISKRIQWCVNGRMETLTPTDWKDCLSASMTQENRITQGIRGGFVMLGRSTSKMTIKQMTDLIELAYSFAAEQGVVLHQDEICNS